ncbi:MAG: cyclic pyranopterin monophosphate synthase MoaC [Planctomycetota bacterium]
MTAKKPSLTHLDDQGRARMVDVGAKDVTQRRAVASGRIQMSSDALHAIRDGSVPKGDVLAVARVAGIQAAKETSRWIPLCHPLPLDKVSIECEFIGDNAVEVRAEVRVTAKTGVEMEALTAATASLLTIYDMCKAIDRGMTIETVQLIEKEGGRSGHWIRK